MKVHTLKWSMLLLRNTFTVTIILAITSTGRKISTLFQQNLQLYIIPLTSRTHIRVLDLPLHFHTKITNTPRKEPQLYHQLRLKPCNLTEKTITALTVTTLQLPPTFKVLDLTLHTRLNLLPTTSPENERKK